jgi:hypothetical protein
MVFGYRGISMDGENTDEVLGDFADEAFGSSSKYKSAWFWAIEDWWTDDTGALIASGTTENNAISRRDNMDKHTTARGTATHDWYAWAWHDWYAWAWHEG